MFGDINIIEESEEKIIIEHTYSVFEASKKCIDKKLHKNYFFEFWAHQIEEKDSFCLCIQYNIATHLFDVAYLYPSDETRARNYYDSLSAEDLLLLKIKDESINWLEFYPQDKVNGDFIFEYEKRPQFEFVVANVNNNSRFYNSGYATNEFRDELRAVFYDAKKTEYIFIYGKANRRFHLKVLDKHIEFSCSYDGKWMYRLDDKNYGDINEIFELLGV